MRLRTAVLIFGVALTGLVGAACSSDDDGEAVGDEPAASSSTTEEAAADRNDADVMFAQMMIPHHEQAIEMAQLAATNAGDPRVKELASRIEAAQAPEIEQMQAWLESWDESADAGGMDGGNMMMSEGDMTALENATGSDFDRMFLEMMVEHHSSAIEMAETEIADGSFADAIALAETIKADQEAEITEMESLLTELGA